LKNFDLPSSEGQNVESEKRPEDRPEVKRVNEDIPVMLKASDNDVGKTAKPISRLSKVKRMLGKNRVGCTSKDSDLDIPVTTKGQTIKSDSVQDVKQMVQNWQASCENVDLDRSARSEAEVREVSEKGPPVCARRDRGWLEGRTDVGCSLAPVRTHRQHSERLRLSVGQLPLMLTYIGHGGPKTTGVSRSRSSAGVEVRTPTSPSLP